MTEEVKHTHDAMRGKIKLSDFKPSNLHPKAKFRILMALIGTFYHNSSKLLVSIRRMVH